MATSHPKYHFSKVANHRFSKVDYRRELTSSPSSSRQTTSSPPYQQSPYPQSPLSRSITAISSAGVGAIVALISFFLPYYTFSSLFTDIPVVALRDYSIGGDTARLYYCTGCTAIVILLQFGEQWFKPSNHPTIQRVSRP